MGWMIQGSIPSRGRRLFSLKKCPDWFWNSPSLHFTHYAVYTAQLMACSGHHQVT